MNTNLRPAPHPNSLEFFDLRFTAEHSLIYEFVHSRRGNPPTMVEIRANSSVRQGESHSQTDRRVRELYSHFDLAPMYVNGHHVYELRGMWEEPRPVRKAISDKIRSTVFRHGRCAQCGQFAKDDGVVLQVDHKWPLHLGGSDELENLQALCISCNHGKKAFYEDFNGFRDEVVQSSTHEEPHKRIGELLKAFAARGEAAPSLLIEMVASAIQYQDDWQKRTRELRKLGWIITAVKHSEDGRVRSSYKAVEWKEWPEGNIAAAIKAVEKAGRASKTTSPASH